MQGVQVHEHVPQKIRKNSWAGGNAGTTASGPLEAAGEGGSAQYTEYTEEEDVGQVWGEGVLCGDPLDLRQHLQAADLIEKIEEKEEKEREEKEKKWGRDSDSEEGRATNAGGGQASHSGEGGVGIIVHTAAFARANVPVDHDVAALLESLLHRSHGFLLLASPTYLLSLPHEYALFTF